MNDRDTWPIPSVVRLHLTYYLSIPYASNCNLAKSLLTSTQCMCERGQGCMLACTPLGVCCACVDLLACMGYTMGACVQKHKSDCA